VTLLPGESRAVSVSVPAYVALEQLPKIDVRGWNVAPFLVDVADM
jgi:hypothetical protein